MKVHGSLQAVMVCKRGQRRFLRALGAPSARPPCAAALPASFPARLDLRRLPDSVATGSSLRPTPDRAPGEDFFPSSVTTAPARCLAGLVTCSSVSRTRRKSIRRPSKSTRLTYLHTGTECIPDARALATQFLPRLVELEVLATQLGDVNQSLNIHGIERDEQAETRDRRHHTTVLLAQVLTHVFAFQPGFHVPAGLIGTPLVGTAVQACRLPLQQVWQKACGAQPGRRVASFRAACSVWRAHRPAWATWATGTAIRSESI